MKKYQIKIIFYNNEKIIHGKYNTIQDAKKFIEWYKSGDIDHVKQIKIYNIFNFSFIIYKNIFYPNK